MTENPLGYEKIPKLLKNFAVPSIVASLVGSMENQSIQWSAWLWELLSIPFLTPFLFLFAIGELPAQLGQQLLGKFFPSYSHSVIYGVSKQSILKKSRFYWTSKKA